MKMINQDDTQVSHPSGGKRDSTVGDYLMSDGWTREKAWWLGATFGDGHNAKNGYSVMIRAQDKDMVDKWAKIAGTPIATKTNGSDCWEATAYRKSLNEWVESFGMKGKKGDSLRWPESMPSEFNADFIRGLWDTDGTVDNSVRKDRGVPRLRLLFTTKSAELADAVADRTPGVKRATDHVINSGPYKGYRYAHVSAQGKMAIEAANALYLDAPEHIRCDRKYFNFINYMKWLAENTVLCQACKKHEVIGRGDTCKFCSKRMYVGAICACGAGPVIAHGKCKRCYSQDRGQKLKSGSSWPRKDIDFLENYEKLNWDETSEETRMSHVINIIGVYRKNAFPWMEIRRPVDMKVMDSVRKAKLTIDGDEIQSSSWVGQDFCASHHWHRAETASSGSGTLVDGFRDDKKLRDAIWLQLKSGDPVTPRRVLNALKAVQRTPANFPSVVARWLVDEFCPYGGTVFDPCAGYGGRLLGSVSSDKNVKYIGNDIEPRTVEANRAMAVTLGLLDSRVQMTERAMEDVVWPDVDFTMTSPPYFDRETYGQASIDNISLYRDVEDWSDQWLGLLIEKCIKHSAISAICVSPIRVKARSVDLPEMVIAHIARHGGKLLRKITRKISRFGREPIHDQIVVFMGGRR